MEHSGFVQVTKSFKMVKPGDVYASEIEEGEVVDGRVAEVALQLGKGVKHPPELDTKGGETKEPEETGQGSLLTSRMHVVPDSKVGAHGEIAGAPEAGEVAK